MNSVVQRDLWMVNYTKESCNNRRYIRAEATVLAVPNEFVEDFEYGRNMFYTIEKYDLYNLNSYI